MTQVRLRFILFPIFMFPLGLVLGSYSTESYISRAGLTCAQQKIVSFGYTHKQIAFAEMAAIIIWQNKAKRDTPGYGKWPLAQKRTMKCRLYKSSTHYQCLVSATPCRIKNSSGNISQGPPRGSGRKSGFA